ncbi:MAG TPA: hypothetical protein VNF26_06555 [Candidatus Baltobacterales bacterium]|nr:hypothetical protein [Candidatus Baltobacterales bacterium]
MGFHLLWFVPMMLLGLPALIVVVVLLLVSGHSGRHAAPLFSPDGRWWWDGREWRPVPQQPAPTQPPPA